LKLLRVDGGALVELLLLLQVDLPVYFSQLLSEPSRWPIQVVPIVQVNLVLFGVSAMAVWEFGFGAVMVLVSDLITSLVRVEVPIQVTRDSLANFFVVVKVLVRVVLEMRQLKQVAAVLIDHAAVVVQVISILSVEHIQDLRIL
jgi:hypothetical protein